MELACLDRAGSAIQLAADTAARVLILTGQPLGEPVAGQGPFVMNTRQEIEQAIADYQSGRMGQLE